jgi:hypothetical protein
MNILYNLTFKAYLLFRICWLNLKVIFKFHYTGWLKALVQYLRRLLGRSFGAENVNNLFFIRHRFRFYVAVALYCCDRLTGAPRWEFVEVHTIDAQLWGSDSSTGNKSDKSPLHEQKSTQEGVLWSDDCKMLQRAQSALFLPFQTRKSNWHVTLKGIVSILKIDNHNNKSEHGNGGESEKISIYMFCSKWSPQQPLKYCTGALNHSVYAKMFKPVTKSHYFSKSP